MTGDLRIHPDFPRYTQHDPQVPVWNVTPQLRGCFHRFFDTTPISPSGRYVAVLRMPDEHHINKPGDAADVVLVDLFDGQTQVIAQTRGWEPQMGANINWGADDHSLIFNDVDTSTWTPQLVRMDPLSGSVEKVPGGVYHVSPDGRFAAAASMERMCRTQLGYGVLVPSQQVPRNVGAPADDGLYITDLQTGRRRLVLPLSAAVRVIPELQGEKLEEWEIYGFHSKWSPDGQRVMFTVRRYRRELAHDWNNIGNPAIRFDVLTCRPDGTEPHNAIPSAYWLKGGHHTTWFADSAHLSCNLGHFADRELRLVRVRYDGADLRLIHPTVRGSGHPTVHPCGHVLADTYAHEKHFCGEDAIVPLRWIDMETGDERALVRIKSKVEPIDHGALRVDAHPAWHRDWRWIAFNGVEDNTRHVYLADLHPAISATASRDRR